MKSLKNVSRIALLCLIAGFFAGLYPASFLVLGLFILPGAFDFSWQPDGRLCVTSTSNRFQNTPCSVVVANNYDTHGTITRSSVAHLTPSQLEDLFRPSGLFADMDAWFRTQFEMQSCGTKVNGLYNWLMSSQKNVGNLLNVEKVDRGPGLLYPFVKARQDSVVNTEFWVITGGAANSAYTGDLPATAAGTFTAGPLTTADKALGAAGDRVLRVVTRYGVDMDEKWFRTTDRINIFNRAGNGQSLRGQWKVLASEVATDLSYVDVLVTSENAGSSTAYDTTPTSGLVLLGINNVNDFESYCANRPTLDPRKRVPFWIQTYRRARRIDSEYKTVFARLMESNEYFRQFGDLPLSERNAQDEMNWQKRWINSFFFGKAISANQTLANWQSLESISTVDGTYAHPGTNGKVIAKRANMVGIYEQLKACGQVRDLHNQLLNLYEFFDEIYNIMRARKSQGKVVNSIDVYTDARTAAYFESAMVAYYRQEYGDIIRITDMITTGDNEMGFVWRSFQVKFPAGIKINIIHHEFFDDMVDAGDDEGYASATRFMWILEMGKPGAGTKGGTIYPGMIASNRKVRTLGELENLAKIDPTFFCTMENITEEVTLISETCTAIVECPANSLMIEGIREGVPLTSGRSGPGAAYQNLY